MLTPIQGTKLTGSNISPPTVQEFLATNVEKDKDRLKQLLQIEPETKYERFFDSESGVKKSAYAVRQVAELGDLDSVKFFIENGVPLEQEILNIAAAYGHLKIVEWYLTQVPLEKHKSSALIIAANRGQSGVVDLLLLQGAPITEAAIDSATEKEKIKLISINPENTIFPPRVEHFWVAANLNDPALLNRFRGRELPVKSSSQKYPYFDAGPSLTNSVKALQKAAAEGNLNHVKFFIENGVPMHEEVLNAAAKSGHLEIVKYLADLPSEKEKSFTPALSIAEENKRHEVVAFLSSKYMSKLQEAEANTSTKRELIINSRSSPTVGDFLETAQSNDTELFSILLKKGGGNSCAADFAMARAAREGNLSAVKFFIENNIEMHQIVLDNAAECNRLEIVKYLVELPTANPKSFTSALAIAAKKGWPDVVDFLISKGVPTTKDAIADASSNVKARLIASSKAKTPNSTESSRAFNFQSEPKKVDPPQVTFTSNYGPAIKTPLDKALAIHKKDKRFTISGDGTTLTYDAYSNISNKELNELGIYEFESSTPKEEKHRFLKVLILTIRI